MKIAILSVSNNGEKLGESLKEMLENDSTILAVNHFHKNIKNIIVDVFENYDGIIAIMASGIIIRSISPLIVSKTTDPAVINIDDNGNFVISLLSGHIGGANKLTKKIASLLNATPVITTSTDVNKRLGIDTLAKDLYLTIDNPKNILPVNKAILEGRKVTFRLNKTSDYTFLYDYIKNNTLEMDVLFDLNDDVSADEIEVIIDRNTLKLKRKKIAIGIGCRRGKSCEDIKKAVNNSLNDLNININRIDEIASASIKKDEKGLLDLSENLNIPIKFIDIEIIKEYDFKGLSSSDFVKSKFGVGGVCEPSALISAGESSKLIYKKTVFNGVTIAIACEK